MTDSYTLAKFKKVLFSVHFYIDQRVSSEFFRLATFSTIFFGPHLTTRCPYSDQIGGPWILAPPLKIKTDIIIDMSHFV